MTNKSDFLQSYSKLVVRTWASDEYRDSLFQDPKPILNEIGLAVPADADVHVRAVEATGDGKIEDQIARWERGAQTGNYELVIANRPDDFDLNDIALSDTQLDAVAGGVENQTEDVSISCCSCTPCCCCT